MEMIPKNKNQVKEIVIGKEALLPAVSFLCK